MVNWAGDSRQTLQVYSVHLSLEEAIKAETALSFQPGYYCSEIDSWKEGTPNGYMTCHS